MKFNSDIRFIDDKLKKSFYKLNDGDESNKELFRNINKALDNLELNCFCGIQIPKKLIPKEYTKKFGVNNVWKYNLPKGWRLIYSVTSNDVVILSLVLELFNHKSYEKRFKY